MAFQQARQVGEVTGSDFSSNSQRQGVSMILPQSVRQELMQSRFKTDDGKPIDQQWFTRKDVQVLLDELEKYLDNAPIATQQELT